MFPIENTRSLHYNYAHTAMPILALGNPKKLYKDLSRGSCLKYLISIWKGLGTKMNAISPCEGIDLSKETLRENLEVFIIQMPKPQSVPEAFLVGIVFGVKKAFVRKEAASARYFTLELGANPTDSADEYHFCEWSGRVISLDHHNYGRLAGSDRSSFVDAIRRTTSA